jgi:hypothetical protein
MSDYSQITDFSAKDLLTTGDPNKLIMGADVDGELDAISTAITSKYDSADLASQAEAEAGTSGSKLMTPERTQQWADYNAGMVGDIQALTDPGADRILFWDDSAGSVAQLEVGSGLAISDTSVAYDYSAAANFTGTLQKDGSDVLAADDIGSTVQGYDAATAKTDEAANFTAGLQAGGSNVLVDSDIGSTVLAYSANVAYTNVANQFSANQTIAKEGPGLFLRETSGSNDAVLYFNSNSTPRSLVVWDRSEDALRIRQYDTNGVTVNAEILLTETGTVDVNVGTFKVGGTLSGPGPCFRAGLTGDSAETSILAQVFSSANFSNYSETFDTDGCFNPTNGRFTPDIAGYYQLSANILVNGLDDNDNLRVAIRKNGTIYNDAWQVCGSVNQYVSANPSTIMYFNGTTDYADLTVTVTDNSWTLESTSDFTGHFIRGA